MSARRRARIRGPLVAAALAAATAWAPGAAAQESWRVQGAWVDDHVAGAVVGFEVRQPIGRVPPPPATGPRVIATRDWMLTAMLAGGLNFDGPGSTGLEGLLYGHAGVMRRLSGDLEPRLGLVAAAYAPAGVGGPALRLELLDVAVLQGGWMVGAGPTVAVEVAGALLCDLFC